MDLDSRIRNSIPEIHHQKNEEDKQVEQNNGNNDTIEQISNENNLLTILSAIKQDRLDSCSLSSSFYRSPSAPIDRTLNRKFHVAALTGHLDVLQELVTKVCIPIDCRDRENSTALLLSCARGHLLCAEYLLYNGADPNARRITGASPLYFATLSQHTRIVELLLNKYKAIVDLSTFDGSTPLHVACEYGFADIVQLLIDSKANINARMNDGTTAIMLACQSGHLPIVQMLVSTGHCNEAMQRLDGVTPLFLVVQHGHEAIFDYFIERIDDIKLTIDLTREDGATPLFKACQKGYDSLVDKILKYKPNLGILRNGESVSIKREQNRHICRCCRRN